MQSLVTICTFNMDSNVCYGLAALSCCSFVILGEILRAFIPIPDQVLTAKKKQYKIWEWYNTAVSFIHSCISGCLALTCVFSEPVMMYDMINKSTGLSKGLVSLSLGYFIYDVIDMVHYKQIILELFLHHTVSSVAFSLAIHNDKYIGFAVASLFLELNSIFLHSRRLMKLSGVSQTGTPYQINGLFLIITHICFRIILCAWMLNWLVMNRFLVPTLHLTVGVVGMVLLIIQNLKLFQILWINDFSRRKEAVKQLEDHED